MSERVCPDRYKSGRQKGTDLHPQTYMQQHYILLCRYGWVVANTDLDTLHVRRRGSVDLPPGVSLHPTPTTKQEKTSFGPIKTSKQRTTTHSPHTEQNCSYCSLDEQGSVRCTLFRCRKGTHYFAYISLKHTTKGDTTPRDLTTFALMWRDERERMTMGVVVRGRGGSR